MLKWDLSKPEENTIARYWGGLRPVISNVVQLQPYWILLNVQNLALKVKRLQKSIRSFAPSRPSPTTKPNSRFTTTPPQPSAGAVDPKTPDLRRFDRGSTSATPLAQKCFKCHGFKHIASNCPTRNLITFIEQGEVIEHEEEENVEKIEDKEYQLQAYEGELLVVSDTVLE